MRPLRLACASLLTVCLPFSAWAGNYAGADLTADDLKALVFSDVPGFRALARKDGATGPWIDRPPSLGSGRIVGEWVSGDNLNRLAITVSVIPSRSAARSALVSWLRQRAAVYHQDGDDQRIGEESWARTYPLGASYVVFRAGRVVASVGLGPWNRSSIGGSGSGEPVVSQIDPFLEDVVRSFACSLACAIRQHPDMMAQEDGAERMTVTASGKAAPSAPALTFGKVAWTSLDAFKHAGAKVTWDAKTGKATVSYGGKTVELTALRREARVNGKRLDLGSGVMVDRFGPVVPVRKIAEALGMKVRATKTTIRLG